MFHKAQYCTNVNTLLQKSFSKMLVKNYSSQHNYPQLERRHELMLANKPYPEAFLILVIKIVYKMMLSVCMFTGSLTIALICASPSLWEIKIFQPCVTLLLLTHTPKLGTNPSKPSLGCAYSLDRNVEWNSEKYTATVTGAAQSYSCCSAASSSGSPLALTKNFIFCQGEGRAWERG